MNKGVLVAINPERAVAFTFDNGVCVAVQTGTTELYIGKDAEYIRLAMYSVMRYEDGSEPQPNTGHSANGYPTIVEVPCPEDE